MGEGDLQGPMRGSGPANCVVAKKQMNHGRGRLRGLCGGSFIQSQPSSRSGTQSVRT